MRKLFIFLTLLLTFVTLFSQHANAQGSAFSGTAFQSVTNAFGSNIVQTAPGAVITVCTHVSGATATPCTGLITLYTDVTDVTTTSNPFNADSNGNFLFFAPSGTYDVSITGVGVIGYRYSLTGTGSTLAGATLTGATLTSPTITGTVSGGASYTAPIITGTVTGGASYTSPTITNPTSTGTDTGTETLSGKTLNDPTIAALTPSVAGQLGFNVDGLLSVGDGTINRPIANIVASVNLTAQQASIGATTFYAVPASGAGVYRISCTLMITQAATVSSTLPNCQGLWTDANTSIGQDGILTSTTASNTLGQGSTTGLSQTTFLGIMNVKASTNIQYATGSYASSGATPMQYALNIRLEYLGP